MLLSGEPTMRLEEVKKKTDLFSNWEEFIKELETRPPGPPWPRTHLLDGNKLQIGDSTENSAPTIEVKAESEVVAAPESESGRQTAPISNSASEASQNALTEGKAV